jgi:hypothetical protein
LARRLVEAGVGLVTVNWQDETKIDGTNTCWDTHQDNFAKLKNLLCPIFDQAFPAFLEDLQVRGLLETTLVVAVGEFGRTPKLGQFTQSSNTRKSGRDHWPHAFTALLAGGGVRGGQVYGATTSDGGHVADKPLTPADLSATVLHHLGIDSAQHYLDEFQQLRHRLFAFAMGRSSRRRDAAPDTSEPVAVEALATGTDGKPVSAEMPCENSHRLALCLARNGSNHAPACTPMQSSRPKKLRPYAKRIGRFLRIKPAFLAQNQADGEGFEPPVDFRPRRFSRPVP